MRGKDAETRLAVLIDADNASAKTLGLLLAEIAKYGTANVRRAYGNWTTSDLNPWKPLLLEHSVQPVQQFGYTTGKNSTDSALIIDAMDLLHGGNLDGFCLISSDSDFTRLAARIREQGLVVYGFGERKTPKAFVSACTTFVYVENLEPSQVASPAVRKPSLKDDAVLGKLLTVAVIAASGDDGWAHLSAVGNNLLKVAPDFDSRTWGYAKLKDLVQAHPDFRVESRPSGEGKPPIAWARHA